MSRQPDWHCKCHPSGWKDKILDYEIETRDMPIRPLLPFVIVEKIRFSITRLKRKTARVLLLLLWYVEKIRFSITRLKRWG